MNFLLDTCAFLWLDGEEYRRFPDPINELLHQPTTTLTLSKVSLWEMAIKRSVGKLSNPATIEHMVDRHLKAGRFSLLDIQISHITLVETLPWHHRDPFDRMIAAQALTENLPLLSADPIFDKYATRRLWDLAPQ